MQSAVKKDNFNFGLCNLVLFARKYILVLNFIQEDVGRDRMVVGFITTCAKCLSPLTLLVGIQLMARCTRNNIM